MVRIERQYKREIKPNLDELGKHLRSIDRNMSAIEVTLVIFIYLCGVIMGMFLLEMINLWIK